MLTAALEPSRRGRTGRLFGVLGGIVSALFDGTAEHTGDFDLVLRDGSRELHRMDAGGPEEANSLLAAVRADIESRPAAEVLAIWRDHTA